ncbi:Asp-tRNA(Asn)/Glu-tRNA(Gln) amidotransferase subunit GatC [Candidatus Saccharibacteria bacterium]|nr:Asp-tRNA(Asn)/Glu-tRNA(Gln) amidotransferase subunit GatC [Candidatus Saccharibacteria bacterium]
MPKSPKLDVNYVAHLARLHLTPSEKKRFSKQLEDVLAHIEQLSKLDLSKVPPTFQTTGAGDVFRDDEVDKRRTLTSRAALSNAAAKKGSFFRIPKIL